MSCQAVRRHEARENGVRGPWVAVATPGSASSCCECGFSRLTVDEEFEGTLGRMPGTPAYRPQCRSPGSLLLSPVIAAVRTGPVHQTARPARSTRMTAVPAASDSSPPPPRPATGARPPQPIALGARRTGNDVVVKVFVVVPF